MPDNNGRRVINIIFRVIIIGAFYTGIKAIYNFYMLMAQYTTLQGENLFSRVALLIDDYMFMIILTVAAIIFNILTRKQIDSKAFIVRTVSIVAALIAGCMSFPAIGMLAYIAIAKYPQLMQMTPVFNDMFTLNEVYTSPMTDHIFFTCILFHVLYLQCFLQPQYIHLLRI